MTKKMKNLLNLLSQKKEQAKSLLDSGDIEGAKAIRDEILEINNKISILKDIEDEEADDVENRIVNDELKPAVATAKEKKDIGDVFFEAIKCMAVNKPITQEILNALKESSDPDGGFVVPRDISTEINTLVRQKDSLINLVSVEKVNTFEGARTFEVNAAHVPFDKVEEEAVFGDIANPTFKRIAYKCSKYGGILKASAEILADSNQNIKAYLLKWLTDKYVATTNAMILNLLKTTLTSVTAIASYDDIKTIINTKIDPALTSDVVILTNQTGYNWLDTLKDTTGNYILKPLITNSAVMSVEGKWRIKILSDKELKVEGKKVPFYIGNTKEFGRMFDREQFTVEPSTVAGDLWTKDQLGLKARFRLDLKAVDEEAVVRGELTVK